MSCEGSNRSTRSPQCLSQHTPANKEVHCCNRRSDEAGAKAVRETARRMPTTACQYKRRKSARADRAGESPLHPHPRSTLTLNPTQCCVDFTALLYHCMQREATSRLQEEITLLSELSKAEQRQLKVGCAVLSTLCLSPISFQAHVNIHDTDTHLVPQNPNHSPAETIIDRAKRKCAVVQQPPLTPTRADSIVAQAEQWRCAFTDCWWFCREGCDVSGEINIMINVHVVGFMYCMHIFMLYACSLSL